MVSLHLVVHGRKLSMPYYLSALFPVINRGSKSIRRDSHSRIIFYAAMTPEKSSFSIFIISFFDKKVKLLLMLVLLSRVDSTIVAIIAVAPSKEIPTLSAELAVLLIATASSSVSEAVAFNVNLYLSIKNRLYLHHLVLFASLYLKLLLANSR